MTAVRLMQPIALDSANLFRLVHFFDVLAAVVFAVSGSLVASRQRLDVMAFMWFAVITGVGGGTVRDLILNVPVFWVQSPIYVSACLVTAVAMHFVAPLVESRYRMLVWFDAFGLALVTVAGTVKASDVDSPALVAIAMGVVTGFVGGIVRDTLGHVPSVLLGHEIYVTASVLGACTYVGLHGLGAGRLPAMIAGFLVTFVVRGLGDHVGLVAASLPRIGEARTLEKRATKIRRRSSDRLSGVSSISRRRQTPLRHHSRCARVLAICADHSQHRAGDGRRSRSGDERDEHRSSHHGIVLGIISFLCQ